MKRLAAIFSVVPLLMLTLATPALAAAPTNDTFAARTVIGSLPFSDSVDTTEATTDADDVEANTDCGAPATDASVWYELNADEDALLLIDVSASDYASGVIVVTGAPGSFSIVTCGPSGVVFNAFAGETYQILVFDDQQDGAGNGGNMEMTIDVAPPPPTIDVTVDKTGSFNGKTGSATISGTVTCSADADYAFVDVTLRQRVGRFIIEGYGGIDVFCDGTTQSWSAEIFGNTGLFKGGSTTAFVNAIACGVFDCGFDYEEATVRLKR